MVKPVTEALRSQKEEQMSVDPTFDVMLLEHCPKKRQLSLFGTIRISSQHEWRELPPPHGVEYLIKCKVCSLTLSISTQGVPIL